MSNISGISQQNTSIIIQGQQTQAQGAESKPLELKAGNTLQGTVVSITDTDGGKIADISVGDSTIQAKLSEETGLR